MKIQCLAPAEIEALGESIGLEAVERYDRELMQLALARAKLEFSARIWRMFELAQIEGEPAEKTAEKCGATVFSVYAASRRVIHRLREIVALANSDSSEIG